MKVENTKGLKIKLKGEDSDNFKSAIKKICDDKMIGFNKMNLSDDERKVIKSISEKL